MCGDTTNSAWQVLRKWCLQTKQCVAALQIQHGENGAVLADKAKMEQFGWERSLSLSLSLSLLALFSTLKFLNTLFLGFCALFVILSLLQKGEKSTKIKENLPFLDTSLTLSMTNLGKSLNLIVCHTQILKHKFKFFTQISRHFVNSKHFINSTHFITLSQILSHTQGFFIFLPQVFAQFLLINSLQRSSYGRQGTKAPF
mgnify:CR=1 FL=1